MSTTKLSLDAQIEMQTLVGEPLSLKVREILWDDEVPNCILYGIIEPSLWQRIWSDGLFQLSPETVLHEAETFEDKGAITLELALDREVLRSLLTSPDPIETFLYGLGGTTQESARILNSASWRAYSVMQESSVPDDPDTVLQTGFRTIWSEN